MPPVSHALSGAPMRFGAPAYDGPRLRPQIRPLAVQEAEARRERRLRPLRAARAVLAQWLPGMSAAPRTYP